MPVAGTWAVMAFGLAMVFMLAVVLDSCEPLSRPALPIEKTLRSLSADRWRVPMEKDEPPS